MDYSAASVRRRVFSLADNGNIQAIPTAILRYIVIAPAFIQIFWTPVVYSNKLISAVSKKQPSQNLLHLKDFS